MLLKRIISNLIPPDKWRIPVIIILGILTGLSLYTLYISKAISYLSDNPTTCVNCHIMSPQYATWSHSAHRKNARCNDCHVPHDHFVNTYYFKAKDGLRHATIFTLRKEPQVIFIKKEGKKVVQMNCIRCHNHLMSDPELQMRTDSYHSYRNDKKCWDCHRESPHGRVNSLSSVPYARVPLPETPVPQWLKNIMK